MNVVFIYGAPAAGKLTVATELTARTGYTLFDNHRATDYLAELFPRTNPALEAVRSQLGRKLRLDIFEAAAKAGIDLITTFAPISPGMHDFVRSVQRTVSGAGGSVLLVHLAPSRQAMLERVTADSRKGRKIETTERWHEVLDDNPDAFATFPDVPHFVLDNSGLSPAAAAEQIIVHYNLPAV